MYRELKALAESDHYPFHMPGHKRRLGNDLLGEISKLDITEIPGFDDLHRPNGPILELLKRTRHIFGGEEAFFLINGSTSGVLSAIAASIPKGGTLLMARNSHKSAYDAANIRRIKLKYLYPDIVKPWGFAGSIDPISVEAALGEDRGISGVFISSPTYEGVISDIEKIAHICHSHGLPLIVDSAHGAHLGLYAPGLRNWNLCSAIKAGADIVIESLHKTLPSFTQTAILLSQGDLVEREKLKYFVSAFQSSSPSYIFIAGLEKCLDILEEDGDRLFSILKDNLSEFRLSIENLKNVKVAGSELLNQDSVYGFDPTKLIIGVKGYTGKWIFDCLREDYHLDLEMAGETYCLALSSIMDTKEGFDRLSSALKDIERTYVSCGALERREVETGFSTPEAVLSISDALDAKSEYLPLKEAKECISASFIYAYPPGIPLLVPGEKLDQNMQELIGVKKRSGIQLSGIKNDMVRIIKDPSGA